MPPDAGGDFDNIGEAEQEEGERGDEKRFAALRMTKSGDEENESDQSP